MTQQAQMRSSPLAEQLCFAMHAASRAMTGYYRPLLDAVGLTLGEATGVSRARSVVLRTALLGLTGRLRSSAGAG